MSDAHRRADPALCADCGVDTAPCSARPGCRHAGRWEDYMIHGELWATTGIGPGMGDGRLCIGCLETRLGRQLTPADFTGAPINRPHPWDTARLRARKAG